MSVRVTTTVAKILSAFLADAEEPQYGMHLMGVTGLASGTVYPILARLEKEGWVTGVKENIDPTVEGRPARKQYLLTQTGRAAARQALAELHEATRLHERPSAWASSRPAPQQ
ncbi:PadR family transcriptional regulator [Streptomyces sp. NPDC055952]|uniref:PadR family transcriptional regulator n=1 Tax=Streptomyces sp. NPDC055952 TaxID=3345663 RepID=UPI0035D8AB71